LAAFASAADAPLNRVQKTTILASYLGWTLDAFDFFLLVFVMTAIAHDFGRDIRAVSEALFLTLAARPVGALAFGWMADRYGRRPVLIIVILLFSLFSVASGLAQSLGQLLVIRALFGAAMGGEWGVGASLVMETIPARMRGRVSGLLQSGYPSGYFLASIAYWAAFDHIGWRGMFFLGLAPALLIALIRMGVEESPAHAAHVAAGGGTIAETLRVLAGHWKLALYLVVLMTAFNFFSHGTQDLYPTFLQKQHHFDTALTGRIVMVMNLGAIAGAMIFGPLSDRIGRKRAIVLASLCALPVIPLWAWSATPVMLGLGAFAIQMAVQGAWAVVPAHLNELSPGPIRAMFPGFVYQVGNLIASRNGPMQAAIAESHHDNYGLALAGVAGATAVVLALWCAIGPERSGGALQGFDDTNDGKGDFRS
jgi:SHS family lactate transporter-like MFS transporter